MRMVTRWIGILIIGIFASNVACANVAEVVLSRTVQKGDTLSEILENTGISKSTALDVVEELEPIYKPQMLIVGQHLSISYKMPHVDEVGEIGEHPIFRDMFIRLTGRKSVGVSSNGENQYEATERERKVRVEYVTLEGEVKNTLYHAALEIGLPLQVFSDFIKLYSFDIDFQRDIREGNQFTVLFEKWVDEETGETADYGHILYSQMLVQKQTLNAYRYEMDGEPRYYNELGKSIEKSLLKTPIDGARITSGFGSRRHPILGFTRMHRGIDFGAPSGTPIYAAGSGRIIYIGRKGTYGNYIQIAHRNAHSTAYAHMRNFAKDLGKGAIVKQGQVIGYVGTTGRSTGPHLHYEVLIRGGQINPLSIKSVPGEQLSGAKLAKFNQQRQWIEAKLQASAKLATSETETKNKQ